MVNFNISVDMYDAFVENEVLGTQDLLKLGLNKNDLTRLVSEGKLMRPKKGQYAINDVEGLINYAKFRFGKKGYDAHKGKKALYKAVELDPNNGAAHSRLFLSLIIDGEYEKAWDSFLVMGKTTNFYYMQDQNMWLYLLSFIKELPEEYQKQVSKLTYDDIKMLPGDNRFSDVDYQEKIRRSIMNLSFKSASGLSHCLPVIDRKLGVYITEILLGKAIEGSRDTHKTLYKLIEEHKYSEAKRLLEKEKNLHGIGKSDTAFLTILGDLILMQEENKLPIVEPTLEECNFFEAIAARDYAKALEMNNESFDVRETKSKSANFLNKLLLEVKSEKERIADAIDTRENVVEMPKQKKDLVGGKLFTDITSNLMQHNIEMANLLIGKYLKHIGKDVYNGYVSDLVKLSVLDNDNSFVEPMETLADIAKDDFEILPAIYIQDFYYNLARKNFKKAAIFLDILGMSEDLGGAYIGVSEMKNRLLEDAAKAGYTVADLELDKKIQITEEEKTAMLPADRVLSVADVMCEVGESPIDDNLEQAEMVITETEGETVVPQDDDSVVEEPSQVTYTVLDVVDRLMEDTNLIMLEPMSEEDIVRVVETTASFQKVQTYVFKDDAGKKRIILRYYNKDGEFVNFTDTLRLANYNYYNGNYEMAIENYQAVLPKMERPRPYIYARLGKSYERSGEYSKAIDCYTMAEVQSIGEQETYEFIDKISDLKEKCNYNGVRVSTSDTTSDSKDAPKQYKKENKNN